MLYHVGASERHFSAFARFGARQARLKGRWPPYDLCWQYSPSASEYRLIFSECHMARGAHGWPSLHICRAAGEANIDEVNRAHRGPYHELNISRYSRTRGEYCTYIWKVRNESFLSLTVLCERLKTAVLVQWSVAAELTWSIFFQLHSSTRR